MTDYYKDLPAVYVRMGRTADRPTDPPDKQAFFWNVQTGKMFGVNDAMEWVEINPDPAPYTGEFHVRVKPVATSIFPTAIMFAIGSLGAFIYEVRFVIDSPYDSGIVLSVGDVGDNSRLMSSSFSEPPLDPQTPGTYISHPLYQYGAGAGVLMYCSSSPTTGSGSLYILYDENPNTL